MNKIDIDPKEKATGALKTLFRGRKEWKDFCLKIREERGNKCEICGKQLTNLVGNVHHLHTCPTMADYMNLEPNRFLLVCTNCHDWCHSVCNSPRFKRLGLANRKSPDAYYFPVADLTRIIDEVTKPHIIK